MDDREPYEIREPGDEPLVHEEEERGLQVVRIVLGSVVAVLFAAATCVAAILSFDMHPAGPAVVAAATIGAGSFAVRNVDDPALKSAAVGLIVGGLAAVLLWPLFNVDSPTIGLLG